MSGHLLQGMQLSAFIVPLGLPFKPHQEEQEDDPLDTGGSSELGSKSAEGGGVNGSN